MPGRGVGGAPGGRRGGRGRGGGGFRGGGRGSKPQRGSRSVPTEEEVLARNATPPSSSDESEKEETPQQEQHPHHKKGPVILADSDLGAGNPNRNPDLHEGPREPTRREREAMEKARHAALIQSACLISPPVSLLFSCPLLQEGRLEAIASELQQQTRSDARLPSLALINYECWVFWLLQKLQAEGKTSQAKADLARQDFPLSSSPSSTAGLVAAA
ncbi:hypothetical protein Esti_002589 [Eimeria stiedai]